MCFVNGTSSLQITGCFACVHSISMNAAFEKSRTSYKTQHINSKVQIKSKSYSKSIEMNQLEIAYHHNCISHNVFQNCGLRKLCKEYLTVDLLQKIIPNYLLLSIHGNDGMTYIYLKSSLVLSYF